MIFFKPDVFFKLKTLDECAKDICTRCFTSNNPYEIKIIKDFLCLDVIKEECVIDKLKENYSRLLKNYENNYNAITMFWDTNKEFIFNEISCALNLQGIGDVKAFCLFDISPLPCVDYYNRSICLPVSANADTNIEFAISHLVKCAVLFRLWDKKAQAKNLSYSKDNVYWIMADLVTDAIFFNTKLKKFGFSPAYKYYYNLIIKNENVIDKIRKEYNNMPIHKFMHYVLDYVSNNLHEFQVFKNRY